MLQRKMHSILPLMILLSSLAFEGYGQVNLQTGSAVFSIPMFNWKDNKSQLNSSVALSYNSGNGLKISDVPSNVGQGWNLAAGGVIVRMQVGEPDDQQANPGNGSSLDISRYPAGYMYASTPAANGCPTALTRYPIYRGQNHMYTLNNSMQEDKQLDYFSFQFNGKTGLFVLDVVNHVGVSLGLNKMKITYVTDQTMVSQGIRTTITSFSIQDEDGLIYKFATHGLTKELHVDFCDPKLTKPGAQPTFKGQHAYHQMGFENASLTNPYIIGSWYLSEVDDPLTGRKIIFNYPYTRSINAIAGLDMSCNYTNDYVIISHKKSISSTPALGSITYPDGHVVTLNYGAARADLNGDYVLSSVDVAYQGRYLSRYLLKTSYFIRNRYGIPSSGQQSSAARLCLQSVTKLGPDLKEDSPPYIFDYYLSSGSGQTDDFVPPPFFYARDIWGFYNGNYSKPYNNDITNSAIPVLGTNTDLNTMNYYQLKGLCLINQSAPGQVFLNPKPNYAKNGLLRQIIYPTGGTLTYDYEQNTGVLTSGGSEVTVGGVHVKSTSSTDGGHSNGCNTAIVTNYSFTLNGPGTGSSLWGLEMPLNQISSSSHYQSEDKRWHYKFPFGECYWNYAYPGILSAMEAVGLTDLQKFMQAIGPALGIISIVTDVVDVLTVALGSTGVLAWAAVIVDIIGGLLAVGITCFSGNNSKDNSYTVFYNSDLNGASPLPAQFKRVEVTESPGANGKTIQKFTSDEDYPVWVPAGANPNLSTRQRFAPWAYGLLKEHTTLDATGNMVKQLINKYDYNAHWCNVPPDTIYKKCCNVDSCTQSMLKYPLGLLSTKCTIKHTTSQRNTDWQNNAGNVYITSSSGDMAVDTYDFYTGQVELDTVLVRDYKQNDPTKYVENMTQYYYNSYYNFNASTIVTTESNGKSLYKVLHYTSDYPTSTNAAVVALKQNNIVNRVMSEATYLLPTFAMLGENVTEYTRLIGGDIVPSRALQQRFSDVSTYPSRQYYNPDNPSNASIYKVTKQFSYDANGNPSGIKDEGGRAVANIFDYNDKYVVAVVANADAVLDKPAYTSFETSSLGGWTLTGSGAASTNANAITGTRTFTFSGGSLSARLNTAKEYTMSCWATAGLTVTGGGVIKSGPVINGLTYYEFDIPQGNSVVVLSGTATVDELRLYPKTATMKTLTYDPILGKTSECDENNRVIYYEYDNLGRLKFIKDENHYALKMYEYNNVAVSAQNGCPGTYYNRQVTEYFTRSNCAAGYQGGDAPYTVPANKYSSAISQAAADARAELELLTNGPSNANTNGACYLIYYNVAASDSAVSQDCAPGMKGGMVTYTVPAGTYSSIISQADANQQAADDIAANEWAYFNSPAHQNCTLDTSPDWQWIDGDSAYCLSVNGQLPPHQFRKATDQNPNSSTYHQLQWFDAGPQDACPAGNYYNAMQSRVFTKACTSGYTGSQVTYTVPPGKYFSTLSQADADQQATNDINANGQNYANTNGTCTSTGCNASNCTGEGKKCINNSCQMGSRVYTTSTGDSTHGWTCYYYYVWSDGSTSGTYSMHSVSPCPVQ